MKSLLLIFLGGGTGSVLRYLLTISIYRQGTTNFPWGTFAVNILGCILIGVFYTLTSRIHINNDKTDAHYRTLRWLHYFFHFQQRKSAITEIRTLPLFFHLHHR